jgi:hypothetical protein
MLAAGSGVPVDQIVQMVGALLEHLMTSSPGAANDQSTKGRPGRPRARGKRRITASEGAHGAADDDAAVPQVGNAHRCPHVLAVLCHYGCCGGLMQSTLWLLYMLQLLMPPDASWCTSMFD